jgi:hypothetical protein
MFKENIFSIADTQILVMAFYQYVYARMSFSGNVEAEKVRVFAANVQSMHGFLSHGSNSGMTEEERARLLLCIRNHQNRSTIGETYAMAKEAFAKDWNLTALVPNVDEPQVVFQLLTGIFIDWKVSLETAKTNLIAATQRTGSESLS